MIVLPSGSAWDQTVFHRESLLGSRQRHRLSRLTTAIRVLPSVLQRSCWQRTRLARQRKGTSSLRWDAWQRNALLEVLESSFINSRGKQVADDAQMLRVVSRTLYKACRPASKEAVGLRCVGIMEA